MVITKEKKKQETNIIKNDNFLHKNKTIQKIIMIMNVIILKTKIIILKIIKKYK